MSEIYYLISDASRQVDVESHVLRYWEDELDLKIPRNDMGHRYYTDYHIRLFRQIKDLKEKGYQLKAIKNALNKMAGTMEQITITEDYMEEDMKAAWKESQMKERQGRNGVKKEGQAAGQSRDAEKLAENGQKAADGDYGQGPEEAQETAQTGLTPMESAEKTEVAEIDAEKMARFQNIMNHVIGQAMEANMDRLTRDVSDYVSEDVTDRVMKEVEYLLRVSDEKEEERFRQLDETLRSYQKNGKGRAEAAATKLPFFKKKKFGKSGKKLF